MPDYGFDVSLVTDQVGGVIRTARNAKITVTVPATGATAPDLKQNGQPVQWATSDGKGRAIFSSTAGAVIITSPNGLARLVHSPDFLQENVNAPASAAAAAASAATAATAAQTALTSILVQTALDGGSPTSTFDPTTIDGGTP